ncbi:MAG: hypothetical protein L6Q76_08405 [Polyangiaceae bacterium]|nr:hypothetical protein [Polyangiaceae bacterium]
MAAVSMHYATRPVGRMGLNGRRVIPPIWVPALAGFVALGSAAGPAFGQTRCARPGSITGNEAEGRRHYEAGVSAADAGDWKKAHAAFLEACRRMHHPFILANLGQAALELGKYREAAGYFSQHLRDNPVRDEKTARVEEMLKRAQAKIGTLTFQAAPGAEILVNGSPVGRAPLRDAVFVEPGLLELVARPVSGPSVRAVRFIATGSTAEIDLTPSMEVMRPTGAGQPPKFGDAPLPTETEESWARRPLIVTGIVGLAGAVVSAGIGTGYYIAYRTAPDLSQSRDAARVRSELPAQNNNLEIAQDFFRIAVPVSGGIGVAALVSGLLMKPSQKPSSDVQWGAVVEAGRAEFKISKTW